MKKCTQCGRECPDNTVFCTECGAKFAQQFAEQKGNANTQNTYQDLNGNTHSSNQNSNQNSNQRVQSDAFYIERGEIKKRGNGKLLAILLPIIGLLLTIIIVLLVIFIPKFIKPAPTPPTPIPPIDATDEPTDEPTNEPEEEIDIAMIDRIISQDANNADFSVCIIDLKNNRTYGTENRHQKMSASAIINVPVLYAAYHQTRSGALELGDDMIFTYYGDGRGEIKKEQDGNYFSVNYIMKQMLNYSDNNATNSLVDYIGENYIESVCNSNSYKSVDIQKRLGEDSDYNDNYISARDACEMLAEIYNSYDNEYINREYLISNFRIYDDASYEGVGRSISPSAMFLNHNAVTSKTYNEIAIVCDDNVEYIITVLSNNGKMETSADTVAKISSYVYDTLS